MRAAIRGKQTAQFELEPCRLLWCPFPPRRNAVPGDEAATRGLLEGVRAMANRVYAGQRWWVEGHRSHIECLYRRQSRACPTLFIIAVAGGGTADRATGEEAEHWEEAETHNEEAVATTRLNATEGSSRADGGGRRQRTGDG